MPDISNIEKALLWGKTQLQNNNTKDSQLCAETLLAEAVGLSRQQLYSHFSDFITEYQKNVFIKFINRRSKCEPLQYILGYTYFRGLKIIVGPGVLIPRPETELLVELALSKVNANCKNVLDLCCGSGCCSVSIASEISNCNVLAVDNSSICCDYAEKNISQHNLDNWIKVIKHDIFEDIKFDEKFDLIVSNPPYVPASVINNLDSEVKDFEPLEALQAGEDGLSFVPRIFKIAKQNLKPGGILALELFEDSIITAAQIAKTYSFSNVETFQDLAEKPRFLMTEKTCQKDLSLMT